MPLNRSSEINAPYGNTIVGIKRKDTTVTGWSRVERRLAQGDEFTTSAYIGPYVYARGGRNAPWPTPVAVAGLVAYKFGSASARAALTST